jgi:hypothetical protein
MFRELRPDVERLSAQCYSHVFWSSAKQLLCPYPANPTRGPTVNPRANAQHRVSPFPSFDWPTAASYITAVYPPRTNKILCFHLGASPSIHPTSPLLNSLTSSPSHPAFPLPLPVSLNQHFSTKWSRQSLQALPEALVR